MPTKFFQNKIDISQSTTGWNVYDLSSHIIDNDAELAYIQIELYNANSTVGIKPINSTWQEKGVYSEVFELAVKIDTNKQIKVYTQNVNDKVFLKGYMSNNNYIGFDEFIDITPTSISINTWQTIDLSSFLPNDSRVAIMLCETNSTSNYLITRQIGDTYEPSIATSSKLYQLITILNPNKQIEFKTNNSNIKLYLIAYVKGLKSYIRKKIKVGAHRKGNLKFSNEVDNNYSLQILELNNSNTYGIEPYKSTYDNPKYRYAFGGHILNPLAINGKCFFNNTSFDILEFQDLMLLPSPPTSFSMSILSKNPENNKDFHLSEKIYINVESNAHISNIQMWLNGDEITNNLIIDGQDWDKTIKYKPFVNELNNGSNTYRYRIENNNSEIIDENINFNFSKSFIYTKILSLKLSNLRYIDKLALKLNSYKFSKINFSLQGTITDISKVAKLQLKELVGDVKYNLKYKNITNIAKDHNQNFRASNTIYSYTLKHQKPTTNIYTLSLNSKQKSSSAFKFEKLLNKPKISNNVATEINNRTYKSTLAIYEIKEVYWINNKIVNEDYYEYFDGKWE